MKELMVKCETLLAPAYKIMSQSKLMTSGNDTSLFDLSISVSDSMRVRREGVHPSGRNRLKILSS